jgi:hypothetical protein
MHLPSLSLRLYAPYSLMRWRINFFFKLNGNYEFLDYRSLDSDTNEILWRLTPEDHQLKFHRPQILECHDYILSRF